MTEMAVPAADSGQERMSPEGRRALFGAWFGFVVDMFDVYLETEATARAVPGVQFVNMKGIGHFPMAENYPLFRAHLLPVPTALPER